MIAQLKTDGKCITGVFNQFVEEMDIKKINDYIDFSFDGTGIVEEGGERLRS